MLDSLKRFFSPGTGAGSAASDHDSQRDVRIATCALFLEMARIDGEFTPQEMETVISIMKEKYGLSGEHAEALVTEADKELEDSVDLWQFARLINENYSLDEKMEVIETLWQMVYVDGKMDEYEHYLMNKLKNLLRLSLDQLIAAKKKVLQASRS